MEKSRDFVKTNGWFCAKKIVGWWKKNRDVSELRDNYSSAKRLVLLWTPEFQKSLSQKCWNHTPKKKCLDGTTGRAFELLLAEDGTKHETSRKIRIENRKCLKHFKTTNQVPTKRKKSRIESWENLQAETIALTSRTLHCKGIPTLSFLRIASCTWFPRLPAGR